MIESCAIAYLKEFLYAFMLYLIPILTYDAKSVIFTFKMKSLIATNLPRKFSFQKVEGDLDCEEARFQVANRDLTGFHQRVGWLKRKQFEALSSKCLQELQMRPQEL